MWCRQGQSRETTTSPRYQAADSVCKRRACAHTDGIRVDVHASVRHVRTKSVTSHCAMGWPMHSTALVAFGLAALVACPLAHAGTGWPVDSSFYDQIKRVVYGDENAAAAAADSSADGATDSPPLPPLSLPLTQASTLTRNACSEIFDGSKYCSLAETAAFYIIILTPIRSDTKRLRYNVVGRMWRTTV